jgi:hypothetical protein
MTKPTLYAEDNVSVAVAFLAALSSAALAEHCKQRADAHVEPGM